MNHATLTTPTATLPQELHPSPSTDDALAADLDALRAEIVASLGESDAAYIRRVVTTQRRLDLAGRILLLGGILPPAWLAGTALLSLAKILENMEIGHNVMHGQWDWMRDPELTSSTWEWDNVCPSRQWRKTHNYEHHVWTNVRGRDRDIGYGILRVDSGQPWRPEHLAQPAIFVLLALLFEYGVGLHDLRVDPRDPPPWSEVRTTLAETVRKISTQVAKDYMVWPAMAAPLGLPGMLAAASGALVANVVRNLWAFTVIFCGHFPDGVRFIDESEIEGETRGGWFRRQIEGSANFTGGPLVHLLSGNLDHQIEHHLFPDLPSNRYAEIAPRVREICERHGLPYNAGSLPRQFATVIRKVLRLSLPWN